MGCSGLLFNGYGSLWVVANHCSTTCVCVYGQNAGRLPKTSFAISNLISRGIDIVNKGSFALLVK